MTIDKIGGISGGSYEPRKKVQKDSQTSGSLVDNVSISDAAKKMAFEARIQTDVQNLTKSILSSTENSDRMEKLKEVKQKLKNGEYNELSPEVLKTIADKISEVLL